MAWLDGRRLIEQLVATHYESLFRYAYRLSGSRSDAEDLAQEAFCKAQAQLKQLRDPERARPWLYSILRNAYLHQARADKLHREVPLETVGDLAQSCGELPAEVDAELLQQALNELPESSRTPIILFYFEEFSYRDIAEQMELPLGTVMSRLARAKTFLKERLLSTRAGNSISPHSNGEAIERGANDGL